MFGDKILWLLPLVGDHNRVGGDMIVVVDIIISRQMRDALTRQGCQLATINVGRNKGLPSGPIGCHLKEADTFSMKK
jgi:hypothetical protein